MHTLASSSVLAFLSFAQVTSPAAPSAEVVEARSLLGEELHRPALEAGRRTELERALASARETFEANPDSELAAIWVGRRLAYLGRYNEAVEWYSLSIAKHPESYRLLRHRGHRHLTLRQLEDAVADLQRAAELAEGEPDELEPDGMPNAKGIPRSTDQSNIHYHLGLAHYVRGDFENALAAYRRCLELSRVNDDMLVATSHWLYMTLRRLGREDEARAVLKGISADMDVIENFGYHELLLMYRGERDPQELLEPEGEDGIAAATVAYGVGNWFRQQGDEERAHAVFETILEGGSWPAFGYLAAEAELARAHGERAEPASGSGD